MLSALFLKSFMYKFTTMGLTGDPMDALPFVHTAVLWKRK